MKATVILIAGVLLFNVLAAYVWNHQQDQRYHRLLASHHKLLGSHVRMQDNLIALEAAFLAVVKGGEVAYVTMPTNRLALPPQYPNNIVLP